MSLRPPAPSPTPERLFAVICPTCGATIAADENLLGRPAECPLCGGGFQLPDAAAPPASRPGSSTRYRRQERGSRRLDDAPPIGVVQGETRPTADAESPANDPGPRSATPVDETAALKRASAERAARRTRRNIVMLAGGGAILLGMVMLLGRKRR